MTISDAKRFIGKVCHICWQDRSGAVQQIVSKIHDVTYMPMYGAYLITDTDDIPLEKLSHIIVSEVGSPVAA